MLRMSLGLCFALMCSAGCGGDDDVAPIDGNKKMSDLTAAEATTLCKAHASDFDAISGIACTVQGLSKGQGAACEAERDACQGAAPPGIDCGSVDTAALDGCDLPVSTVEPCLDEFGDFARSITCDKEPPSSFNPPACFTEVRANCPLFQ
jgi:hypothetical protein